MAQHDSKLPPAAGATPGKKTRRQAAREVKVGYAVRVDLTVKKRGPKRAIEQTTLEARLEAKAARGDRENYSGPGLDEMSREQRHKLLYGD